MVCIIAALGVYMHAYAAVSPVPMPSSFSHVTNHLAHLRTMAPFSNGTKTPAEASMGIGGGGGSSSIIDLTAASDISFANESLVS